MWLVSCIFMWLCQYSNTYIFKLRHGHPKSEVTSPARTQQDHEQPQPHSQKEQKQRPPAEATRIEICQRFCVTNSPQKEDRNDAGPRTPAQNTLQIEEVICPNYESRGQKPKGHRRAEYPSLRKRNPQ